MKAATGNRPCGAVVLAHIVICALIVYTHLYYTSQKGIQIRQERDAAATTSRRMVLRFPVSVLPALQRNLTLGGRFAETDKNQNSNTPNDLTRYHYNGEVVMRQRAKSVKQNCKMRPLEEQTGAHSYIGTAKSRAFAYFPVAKCGWTSWIAMLFENAGMKDYWKTRGFKWGWDSPYYLANMAVIPWTKARLYKERILFVRNPYDRLVSAYKNKVLYGPYSAWMKKPCIWINLDKPPITFPQFVKCIVDKARVSSRSDLSSERAARNLDIHWTPQYWSSLPCSSSYTLVGKFEHMQEDMEAAVKVLDLNVTQTTIVNRGRSVANETLGYWYNQLPEEHRQGLRQIYRLDFDVFGFDDSIPVD